MKLQIQNRYKLPESITLYYPPQATIILKNGKMVSLGLYDGGEKYCLVSLEYDEVKYTVLYEFKGVIERHHKLTLIAINDGSFGIIDNGDTLYIYEETDKQCEKAKIQNHEIFSELEKVPRTQCLKVIGETNNWQIIFAENNCSQNPRFIAELKTEESHKYRWEKIFGLNCEDFPEDRFGMDFIIDGSKGKYNEPPIIGSTMIRDNRTFVFVEGSDSMSVNKYGMDYYSLVEIDKDGKIADKLYEVSGHKRISGKHGVRGCFTSSKDYLILTPVFSSDEWKGKQKLFNMANKSLIDIEMPKGLKEFKIIDHMDGHFYLTDFKNEIIVCTIV